VIFQMDASGQYGTVRRNPRLSVGSEWDRLAG